MVLVEGLGKLKNSVMSGIDPATFWLVACYRMLIMCAIKTLIGLLII
jgi:hypothetical protein